MTVTIKEGPHELESVDVYKDVYVEPRRVRWHPGVVVFFDLRGHIIASAICNSASQSTRDQAEQWLYDLTLVTAVGRPPTETEIKEKVIK